MVDELGDLGRVGVVPLDLLDAWLLEDGSILALIEYHSLWRIGPDQVVRWVYTTAATTTWICRRTGVSTA